MPIKDPEDRKKYHNKYNREIWYPAHAEERKQQVKDRRRAIYEWYAQYKSTLKCARCSEWRPECLSFHHVDESLKEFNISEAARSGRSIDKIKEEINKCIVLCHNCHAVETRNRAKKWCFF